MTVINVVICEFFFLIQTKFHRNDVEMLLPLSAVIVIVLKSEIKMIQLNK